MSSELLPAAQSAFAPGPYDAAEITERLQRLGISTTPQSAAEIAAILQSALRPEPHP